MLAWVEEGGGPPVLLIHGFASNLKRNWDETGWMQALARSGFRAIAYDQRGHGASEKRYDPADYALERLVDDAVAVLDAAGAGRAALMGYSLGARVVLEAGLAVPERARALVVSGLGSSFREFGGDEGDRDIVAQALEAASASGFPKHARFYRRFAEQSRADPRALAACWRRPVHNLTNAELSRISAPSLFVVGDQDGFAGNPEPIATAMPNARVVRLVGKNHMNAVGAKEHRDAVLAFLRVIAE
jgi:pimeloyl-ACP methyl ester carboxylesterase